MAALYRDSMDNFYLFFVLQFVTNPEIAAKRKIAKQQKKKEAKKRKMDTMKGRAKNGKRRRKEDVELDFS